MNRNDFKWFLNEEGVYPLFCGLMRINKINYCFNSIKLLKPSLWISETVDLENGFLEVNEKYLKLLMSEDAAIYAHCQDVNTTPCSSKCHDPTLLIDICN